MPRFLSFSRALAGPALAAALMASILVSASAAAPRGGAAAGRAPTPQTTVKGYLVTRFPDTLAPGTRVKSADLGTRVFPDARHGFALAGLAQADYPAATTDGGKTWRTDGPALHVAAAQAPLSVTNVGAANAHTYFACCSGQVVDVTNDSGKHWWRAILGEDVVAVTVAPGSNRLIAFTQVPASRTGSRALTWAYVSTDGGRHWRYNDRMGVFPG